MDNAAWQTFILLFFLFQLLPHIPRLVASLKKEDSNSATSSLEQLAELIHCMFFRFSGFPDLYEPVLEAIKVRCVLLGCFFLYCIQT